MAKRPTRYRLGEHQYSLPLSDTQHSPLDKTVESRFAEQVWPRTAVPINHVLPDDRQYDLGVSISSSAPLSFRTCSTDHLTLLNILKSRIGFQSALLLEMLGYQTLWQLARSGYCLKSIPSIGPKKIEKIIAALEEFGFAPPRRPPTPQRHWQRLLDQGNQ